MANAARIERSPPSPLSSRQENEDSLARLKAHLADSPPGALEAAHARIATQATLVSQLERKADELRGEVERWRGRTRGAIASERLVELHAGPRAMVRPSGWASPVRDDAGAVERKEQQERLEADLAFWRAEATAERELQSKLDAAQSRVESEASRAEATIEEYKEALKLAAAGEVEKMRDELECMREELEEAKRDRELAINFAGGAADDVAKAAGEAAVRDVAQSGACAGRRRTRGRAGRSSPRPRRSRRTSARSARA